MMNKVEFERLLGQNAGDITDTEKCQHKFIHLDTVKQHKNTPYQISWHRTDIFYCEKCLEIKEIAKVEDSRSKPNWY